MTATHKKRKHKVVPTKPARIGRLWESADDELALPAEENRGQEARWNRPRKQRISLRVDREVVDWFKSKGPGYQTRINRVLRKVMIEGKRRAEKG